MIICDLHTHSTASDGRFTPNEVVERANLKDVKYLALTDHDTLSGIEDAKSTAEKFDLYFIPGIELSTTYKKETVHLLGYFRGDSYKNKELIQFLEDLKIQRITRAKEIVARLKKYNNIEIKVEDVLKNGKDTIARPHIAKTIIEAGYPFNNNYIFEHFIGDDCPAYIPANRMSTEEGIALLKKYNAVVVLAHPVLFKRIAIEDILHLGFDGIEGIYPLNAEKDESKFRKLATENNLIISCGSDSHGMEDTDDKHGCIGSMKLDEVYVEKLVKALGISE